MKFKKIRTKLLTGFILVLSLVVAVNIYAILQMSTLASLTLNLYEHPLRVTRAVLSAHVGIVQMHRGMKEIALATDSAQIDPIYAEVNAGEKAVYDQLDIVAAQILGEEGQALQKETRQLFAAWRPIREEVVRLSKAGRKEEATAIVRGQANQHVAKLEEQMGLLRDYAGSKADGFYANAQTTEQNAIMISSIALAGAVLASIAFGLWMANNITRPIQAMTTAAGKLALGDVQQTVEVVGEDEIGVMANAFRRMIAYIQAAANAATSLAHGDVTVDITPQSEQDVLGYAFTQMIDYQQEMAAAATRLAEGDVTVQVTPQSEQDVLGYAFTQMIANLSHLVKQVQTGADQVADASAQLSLSTGQAGHASQQVSTSIQQIAKGTSQQAQSVGEATQNVEQLSRATEGIARGAQEQANGTEKTSRLIDEMTGIIAQMGQITDSVTAANSQVTQAARQGAGAVQQTATGMETIRARTTAAAERVKEMGSRSKEIGRIVETIDEIADKTDMLALNAAVEAARAGDHGRGFAVVAAQVRKLSEDSKEATRDIGKLIERVQETVNEAVVAMDSTVLEVNNGARLAGDTTQALEKILRAAEEAATLAGRIGGAVAQLHAKNKGVIEAIESVSAVVEENIAVVEQMSAGSREISQSMEGIASVAQENSAATEQVNALAQEMSAQVEEIVASTEQLTSLADQLRAAAAQFRVVEESPRQFRETPERNGRPLSRLGPKATRRAALLKAAPQEVRWNNNN
jgi:methyl-accepting chemotaxis protein